jgi:hypothetical protein
MGSKISKLGLECMFSGAVADSEEHVIPDWLQRRFNLANQEVILPNQTAFRYAKAKAPVRIEHNREFGKIENSIAKGSFTSEEAYLWALKIHIGMMWIDSRLKRERKDPYSATILKGPDFAKQVLMFRELYKNWANRGRTDPTPFGSVFLLDGALMPNEFDFFHCMISGALGISIDNRFLFVLLWDRAEAMRGCALRNWYQTHRPRIESSTEENRRQTVYIARHVWCCEVAHELFLWRRPFRFREQDNVITATPSVETRTRGPIDPEMHIKICRSFAVRPLSREGQLYYAFDLPAAGKENVANRSA